ncbi:MAG TPA: lysophospholipid acyltransferase family protein [Oligoflexus sp.]|uniref:lysophospholipid acyltransferase family protein n=1 Tax=Oligoflexus sp. TaxID=1971216 RepID=UPI002D42D14F|nr:lysophospholipid acyltransferase family protein [Oligoflexus sp.]HYX32110.1 lysophospholipid acyltransferase family protein [Oligoflexus sp.]
MSARSRLITILLKAVLRSIASMPASWIPWTSRVIGFWAPRLSKRDQKLIASNVQRVYALPAHSSFAKSFEQQVFRSQWCVLMETLRANLSQQDPIQVEGLDELAGTTQELQAAGKGLIIVTAHLGNWEFVARYTARASGRRFHALAKPSKLPELTAILDDLRQRMNTAVLWTDSKSILKDMLKLLKAGECLGFVMDQKPEGRVGPVVRFFQQPTEFVSGPAKLSIRQGSPVLAVFCMRTGLLQYRIIQKLIVPADHGCIDEIELTQRMATSIESVIRLYPEQWLWNYKRWRPSANPSVNASSTLSSV